MLAPSRGDRARLEALLSDVWTREVLPFPGMTARARNEHLIRTSAHSVMRKLSVTSIASTFTKRSASLASITRGGSDEDSGGEDDVSVLTATPVASHETAPPVMGNDKSRLSIIDDESDRAAPSTIRARSTVGSIENSRSPRRRMRLTKSPSAWQVGEIASGPHLCSVSPSPSTPATTGALRARSANGPQLERRASLLSRKSFRSVCSAMDSAGRGVRKKTARDQQEVGDLEYKQSQYRSSARFSTSLPPTSLNKPGVSRWSKVDMLRRGAVAQGIRGFFQ